MNPATEQLLNTQSLNSYYQSTFNYYLQLRPYIESYRLNLITNPKNIENLPKIQPTLELLFIDKLLEELISKDQNNTNLYIDKYTLKLLELYFFGIETKFDFCINCSNFSIEYPSFKICACDKDFHEELNSYKQFNSLVMQQQKRMAEKEERAKQEVIKKEMEMKAKIKLDEQNRMKLEEKARADEERRRVNEENKRKMELMRQEYLLKHPPFGIWDKAEAMLRKFLGKNNACIHEIKVFYDCKRHKTMWDKKEELSEFILSGKEVKSSSNKKRLIHDGLNSCFYVLGDIKNQTNDTIELTSNQSLIVLYELIIGR